MESRGIFVNFVEISRMVFDLILEQQCLFEPLPKALHVVPEPFTEISIPMLGDRRAKIDGEWFEKRAVLISEGIAASAMGANNYIYRTKGVRGYLFEDGYVCLLTPYSTIDERGFSLENAIWDGMGDFEVDSLSDNHPLADFFEVTQSHDNDKFERACISEGLISVLVNIKKPFIKDYALELLLTPPDVNHLSEFSLDVRHSLWDIALSDEFEATNGAEWQSHAMELLIEAGISPAPIQIIEYIRQLRNDKGFDNVRLMERLDALEKNLSGSIKEVGRELRDPEFWGGVFGSASSHAANLIKGFKAFPTPQSLRMIVMEILDLFKVQVEDRGLWKELWFENSPKHENTVQNLFFSMATAFCEAHDLDITPEANAGNGPVDFKISKGNTSKVIVEFKLTTSTAILRGYDTQLEVYKKADKSDDGIFVLVDVGGLGSSLDRLNEAKKALESEGRDGSEILYIDGKQKQSASKRRS